MYDVALALLWRAGRWLVARRPAGAHLGGLWEFPDGKRHAAETSAAAALRELAEECAVAAVAVHVLPPVVCEYTDRVVQLTPVLCRWRAGEPRALANDGCRWVTSAELAVLDMPAVNAEIVSAALRATADPRWLIEE